MACLGGGLRSPSASTGKMHDAFRYILTCTSRKMPISVSAKVSDDTENCLLYFTTSSFSEQ